MPEYPKSLKIFNTLKKMYRKNTQAVNETQFFLFFSCFLIRLTKNMGADILYIKICLCDHL